MLTLDDPLARANTMNDRYVTSMTAVVDRLYAERDDIARRGDHLGQEDVLRRRRPGLDGQGDSGGRRGRLRHGATGQGRSASARARSASRSSPPSTAPPSAAASRSRWPAHHRIAVDDGRSEIGCPEVTLGLLPGGGGVTRTVRMFGMQDALMNVLVQGQRNKPAKALAVGLVDELVDDLDALVPTAKQWVRDHRDDERGRQPALGPPWLQDAGRHSVDPEAGAVPAGLPGQPAQAAQGRALPGAARDHERRGRGRADRLRDRDADRVALLRRPGHRPDQQEHDPGVLLRPPGDQRRPVATRRRARLPSPQGRRARGGHDGRRHRLRVRPRRHGGGAQGRLDRGGREGQGVLQYGCSPSRSSAAA